MPIYDPTKLGAPACHCGRLADKRHCPACGAYTSYAVLKKVQRVDPTSGTLQEYACYRCRACGIYYDEWQWRNECKSPPYKSNRRQRIDELSAKVLDTLDALKPSELNALDKVRSGQAEYGSEERKAGLAALFKNVKPVKRDE